MPRPTSPHPTPLELEILKILWRDGRSPVRHVRQSLANTGRDLAHTSVTTIMTIMIRKGYLRRTNQDGAHLYTPMLKERSTLRRMLQDLVDRAFGGSASSVMAHLLQTSDLTPHDLKQLRDLVARKSREKSKENDATRHPPHP